MTSGAQWTEYLVPVEYFMGKDAAEIQSKRLLKSS
jgi:hypothetical protein